MVGTIMTHIESLTARMPTPYPLKPWDKPVWEEDGQGAARADRLAALKGEIAAIAPSGVREGLGGHKMRGGHGRAQDNVAPFGIAEIDRLLPHGGLDRGALHAVLAGDSRDMPAALGFAAGLAARLTGSRAGAGPILWVGRMDTGGVGLGDFGGLYGPGLMSMGLDPDRLILARVRRQDDMLWALEQGLACPDLAAVVGEVDPAAPLSLTAARRLQLAAAASGVPALLVGGHAGREDGLVAAVTRWCVASARSHEEDMASLPALAPRFEVALSARGARPGHWRLDWRAGRFSLSERPAAQKMNHLAKDLAGIGAQAA
jgi:protein ImuA